MFLFTEKKTPIPLLAYSAIILTISNASLAEPNITSINGHIQTGEIQIKGLNFSEKLNAAPFFLWLADDGEYPSDLGRKTSWDETFKGEENTEIVRDGSSKSIKWDHGTSEGAALSSIKFNSEMLYVYRTLYEAFDITKSYAIRTRINNISGSISIGDIVSGKTSGATGTISRFDASAGSSGTIYYSPQIGTGSINTSNPVDFIYDEEMVTNNGASFNNSEGSIQYPTGTFRTFNYKTMRLWNKEDQNNSYPVSQGILGSMYDINHEHTDSTLRNSDMDIPLSQIPEQWQTQELQYKSSQIDISDGRFDFTINGQTASENTFISRTTQRPNIYNIIYQSQVSNGAQPNSNVYYDTLYVDDTWHRVILCNSGTWSKCTNREIQIPTKWTNSEITVKTRIGTLEGNQYVYLYVIDADGKPNSAGYKYCPKCIVSIPLEVK